MAERHSEIKTAIIRAPMNQNKIFVADEVSDTGLQPLRDAGFSVEKRTRLNPQELSEALAGCAGLVVRSETKVTADLMDNAPALRVVGRAGVGVDNIDVPAATARGIVVMNAPDGNTITTAEHTIALLVALARRVPQANSSLKSGYKQCQKALGLAQDLMVAILEASLEPTEAAFQKAEDIAPKVDKAANLCLATRVDLVDTF